MNYLGGTPALGYKDSFLYKKKTINFFNINYLYGIKTDYTH